MHLSEILKQPIFQFDIYWNENEILHNIVYKHNGRLEINNNNKI